MCAVGCPGDNIDGADRRSAVFPQMKRFILLALIPIDVGLLAKYNNRLTEGIVDGKRWSQYKI